MGSIIKTDPRWDELSRLLADILWHFGPRGPDGECCRDLTMPEFMALAKVSETMDCPVREIGSTLGYTKSGATRMVDRLEKKGLVSRARSEIDGRICCIKITKQGKDSLETAFSVLREQLDALLSRMPDDSVKLVIDALILMAKAVKNHSCPK